MFEFQDYLRAPSSVQLLIELAKQHNVQGSLLLVGTGLSLSRLNDANCVVSAEQEIAVITNLIQHLAMDTTALGLVIGFQHKLTTYGILGYALMSSATGLDAFKLAKRYLPLTYTFVKISFRLEKQHAIISFTEPASLSAELQQFVVARAMAATSRVISDIYESSFQFDAFHLKNHQPQQSLAEFPQHFLAAPILFEQKSNELIFNAAQLNQPLSHANANTAAMCERLCTELITQRHTTLTTTMIVRDFLSNAPSGKLLTLPDIASKFHISERTLKRRLQEENSSFRLIQNETLQQRANEFLCKDLSLAQVAEDLGFSDLSTFSQAYKRWTGITPSQFKKEKKPTS